MCYGWFQSDKTQQIPTKQLKHKRPKRSADRWILSPKNKVETRMSHLWLWNCCCSAGIIGQSVCFQIPWGCVENCLIRCAVVVRKVPARNALLCNYTLGSISWSNHLVSRYHQTSSHRCTTPLGVLKLASRPAASWCRLRWSDRWSIFLFEKAANLVWINGWYFSQVSCANSSVLHAP